MAIETLTTDPYPGSASDLVTLQECWQFLKETGHPAAETTMRRWITNRRIPTRRARRGVVLVSFSAMLVAHAEWVSQRAEG